MRAAKNPTIPAGPAETLRHDTIGHNNGNLLFAAATHALLSIDKTRVDTRASFKGQDLSAQINEKYDGVVLPLANCFRPAFKNELQNLTKFINGLKIPFAMLSGGAQIEYGDPDYTSLEPISDTVKQYCKAVLDKSTEITVRGEATADYLKKLGFRDVSVIGCPSLTRMDSDFTVGTSANDYGMSVAYNIETSKDIMGATIRNLEHSGANLTYFPQDIKTLETLFWCRETYPSSRNKLQPLHLEHPHIRDKKVEFYLDAAPWISRLRNFDMAIGPRIHGAVSAISAGTPALLVAHDLRTEELASYHGIPTIKPNELQRIKNSSDIWELLDYSEFNRKRKTQVELVVRHLEANGFTTTLSAGREGDRNAYFQNLSAIDYPPAVLAPSIDADNARFAELRRKVVSLTEQMRELDKRLSAIAE